MNRSCSATAVSQQRNGDRLLGESLNPTVVHLNDVMGAARPILDSLMGGAVRYVTTILPDVWPVRVRSELELAVVNTCVNARDAMGQKGGTISLTADNTSLKRGDIADDLEGDFVVLTVADTGQSMPPDILAKVFDPFFTTKGEGKGTGIGLSQVHGFVHQSGGRPAGLQEHPRHPGKPAIWRALSLREEPAA
jgi:signal transduction histidine kinase